LFVCFEQLFKVRLANCMYHIHGIIVLARSSIWTILVCIGVISILATARGMLSILMDDGTLTH
jgi:hypothetical protein